MVVDGKEGRKEGWIDGWMDEELKETFGKGKEGGGGELGSGGSSSSGGSRSRVVRHRFTPLLLLLLYV